MREIDVLAADKLLIGHVEMFLPDALGRDHAGKGVSRAAFGRDDDEELAAVFVE